MLERFGHFVILPSQVVIPKGLLYRVVQVLIRKLKPRFLHLKITIACYMYKLYSKNASLQKYRVFNFF